uniref:Uncharacterized protein n=1 Tax=Trichobilharzia regenti TaxID=157069 RepID=A0AA85K021_TRIRE|nr:unnamed protein product [Trichobilharzia regenti]
MPDLAISIIKPVVDENKLDSYKLSVKKVRGRVPLFPEHVHRFRSCTGPCTCTPAAELRFQMLSLILNEARYWDMLEWLRFCLGIVVDLLSDLTEVLGDLLGARDIPIKLV